MRREADSCADSRRRRTIVKYGGNAMTLGGHDPVLDECAELYQAGDAVVIVHGGGPQIDAELARRGVAEQRIAGQRVTDAATLRSVEAVLCGTVNKALVRALLQRNVSAVGVCGQDGGMLGARRLLGEDGIDLGFVGAIERVDVRLLRLLLDAGILPVVAPLALDVDRSDALNVNADGAAGAIAGALGADVYVNVTNVARVRLRSDDATSEVAVLKAEEARAGMARGDLSGSIVPKLSSALHALRAGTKRAFICGAAHAPIATALAGGGTEVLP